MIINIKSSYRYIAVIVFFFLGIIVGFSDLFHPMIGEADTYMRSIMAAQLYHYKTLIKWDDYFWLPFHTSLLSISFYIINDMYFVPRLVTLIFSSASISILYAYSYVFSKSNRVATIASVIYLFFPLRLVLSTQTLSEPVFVFFLLGAIYFLQKTKYLESLIFLNIAHGIRYDSWFVIPLFFLHFFSNKDSKIWKKFLFMFFSFLVPVFHLFFNQVYYGNPFAFLFHKYNISVQFGIRKEYFNLVESFNTTIFNLSLIFPKELLFLTILGCILLLVIKNKSGELISKNVLILPGYFFLSILILTYSSIYDWYPLRYFYTFTAFSIPIIANLILVIFDYVNNRLSQKKILLMGIIVILYSLGKYINLYAYTQERLTTGSFSNGIISPTEMFKLVEVYNKQEKNENSSTNVKYLYEDLDRYWTEIAFYYFTNEIIDPSSTQKKNAIENPEWPYRFYVAEKLVDKENQELKKTNEPIYESDHYLLLKHN